MRRFACALAVCLLLAPMASAQTPPVFADSAALDEATRAVASQLRCPVCQGLSIEDSPSELAQSMRAVVRDQLAEGKTPEEIKAYFVERYSEWVLLEPKASGFNLTVYLLPIALVLAGLALIFVLARRWSRATNDAGDTVAAEDPDLAPWDELVPRS